MSPITNSTPGYLTYYPQTGGTAIHFSVEAQWQLLSEVMAGFGAIPKRGAEVGGVLLGRREGSTIWVDEIVPIPCEHRRGPSFLLSEKDARQLGEMFERLRAPGAGPLAVGMFRSNTRERDVVTADDREVFNQYFPPPDGVFLLVRPHATKASTAFFVTYSDSELPETSPNVYSLEEVGLVRAPAPRRRVQVLGAGGSEPALEARSVAQTAGEPPGSLAIAPEVPRSEPGFGNSVEIAPPATHAESPPYEEKIFSYPSAKPRLWRGRVVSVLLWIAFVVMAAVAGFQAALSLYPRPAPITASTFTVGLSMVQKGESLHLRWDREAPAIRFADRGRLRIQDGQYSKSVDLDRGALQNGSVIYPPVSDSVTLRLEIVTKSGSSLVETVHWAKNLP
jgi:hypothetical protein